MDIRFSGRNLEVTDGMKVHCREKLGRLEHYGRRLIEAHVILVKQKYMYGAEINLLGSHLKAVGKDTSKDNIFTAFDLAYAHVEKQLKKFREKIKDHRKKDSFLLKRKQRSPRQKAGGPVLGGSES